MQLEVFEMKEFIPLLIIILSMIVSACTVQTPTEQPPTKRLNQPRQQLQFLRYPSQRCRQQKLSSKPLHRKTWQG